MRAGPHFPEPRHAALRRVVGAGLTQFGEKTEQVSALLAVQVVNQPGRHERTAHRAVLDVVFRNGDFLVRHVADDELLVVFAH